MANCNEHFGEYNSAIRLTDARRKDLKRSRKELRNKVRNWFKENRKGKPQPKFNGQGSMVVDTIINPLPRYVDEGGEEKKILFYDVDDGIYFEGELKDRDTPEQYHEWVYEAVKGHTDKDPVDKNACIRTIFSDGHNIDQPIYYIHDEIPELAHKKDGWIDSDPREFTRWFEDLVAEQSQLRLLVRYAKGWADNMEFNNSDKQLPCGLVLTILFTQCAVYRIDRDDVAMKETLLAVYSTLKRNFACYRPTTPKGENLLENYKHKEFFMEKLEEFIHDATKALQHRNIRKATEHWRKHLSNRFPLGEDKEEPSNSSSGLISIIPPTTKPYAK